MYADNNLNPVQDYQQYIAEDGTHYPGNYPKDEISELHLVTETTRPTDPTLVVTGFTIDEDYLQVWTTRDKTSDELLAELVDAAKIALAESDMVAIRCYKAAVAFPSEWLDYVTDLRAIVNGGEGPLPEQPEYPAGT